MDHRGAPCQEAPEDHRPTLRYRLRTRDRGNSRLGMGGPGPPVGPIPNSTLDSSRRHIRGGCGNKFERLLCTTFVAGADKEETH